MPLPPVPAFKPIANQAAIVTAPNVRFTVLTDRILRTEFNKNAIFEDRPSQFFWYRDQPVPASAITVIRSDSAKVGLEDIPVFAKAGAIVPLAPRVGWGGIENPKALDIYIFPGADNRFELYEDDGETTDYQRGKYAITRFTLKKNIFIIQPAKGDVELIPSKRKYRIHLRGVDETASASLPGKYDPATRTLSLKPITLKPTESLKVQFNRQEKCCS